MNYFKVVISGVKVEVQMLDDKRREDPARICERLGLIRDLNLILAKIGEREAKVIRLHWGLGVKRPMILNEIAKRMKLSRERVRQLEERGLLRLRRLAVKAGLIDLSNRPERLYPWEEEEFELIPMWRGKLKVRKEAR
ncbi:MAG: sigma factor-like helix-turn-helix DNA-binding protein [Minisyncoccota bacterium]